MFMLLMAVVFVIALVASATIARLFDKSIKQLLARIVAEDISHAWARYLKFAI